MMKPYFALLFLARAMLMTACDLSAITKPWNVQVRVRRYFIDSLIVGRNLKEDRIFKERGTSCRYEIAYGTRFFELIVLRPTHGIRLRSLESYFHGQPI